MIINTTVLDGHTYYDFTARGVNYTLRCYQNEWELHSRRKSLSSLLHCGTFRHFSTLRDIEKTIKSLKGLSQLLQREPQTRH